MAAPERSEAENVVGEAEEEQQVASNKVKSDEIFTTGTEENTIPSMSLDQEQTTITERNRTCTSSGASNQTSPLSTRVEPFLESGETCVDTSSAYLQFSQQQHGSEGEREVSNSIMRTSEDYAGTEDSEEEETQLMILDPDHPLMTRFQSALKNYLTNQLQTMNQDLREMTISMKRTKKEREELGVLLYSLQQELAQLQLKLEKQHDRHSLAVTQHRQGEEELEDIRNLYKKTREMTNEERKRVVALQTEVENLALRLFYVQSMKHDVLSDIAVMKRAVHKAEVERMKAEEQKLKQDLYVDHQTRQITQLNEQIAMYSAQIAAQSEETKAARFMVAEAGMEIDAISLEKKQLLQQWNSSLIGMSKRDEAFITIRDALSEAQHQLRTMEAEIEGYKLSAMKEEEKNEHLAVILNRAENEVQMNKKLLTQCLNKQEALKVEYSTYTRTLHETEHALNKVIIDRSLCWNELSIIRKQTEEESQIKMALKNQILERLQEKMTSNKAVKYAFLLTEKLRKRKFEQELEFSKVENDMAQVSLEINYTNSRMSMLQKTLSQLDQEVQSIHELISCSENEIAKRMIIIQHKQNAINLLTKKIDMATTLAGGKAVGPLELQIKNLSKDIEECSSEIIAVQQYWLRLQNELVKLTQEREEQEASVEISKKELSIRQQQKIRLENEIEQEKIEKKDIERYMANLSNDMAKLTSLLSKNNSSKEDLQQSNQLMETDFIRALKAAEKESIEMQEKRDGLQEEKERMLSNLVEAEHQIMLWEKKIQLAREMRYAVDSSVGHGEIRAMRAEVRQMQNLARIVAHQSRQKHLQAVKEGRYTLLYQTQQSLDNEMYKQMSRMHTISTIIHQIQQEYPQYQGALRKISLALEARLGAPEETMDTIQ
ncbi:coiled-coil domain-containing protein 40 isoform X2 [Rhinatrema bivittatum]|uniref:coiled-coil domain-containing protein 40 isoform X2 n=1 Tax=Rhinatrema bivittatum TaxID=194408 RepID=UPI0011270D18|nr:coiled-coil domain-containing protein 40 isoform X2 [Rhinatrema bivittatum]